MEAVVARRSLAGALGGQRPDMRKPSTRSSLAILAMIVVVVEVSTYALFASGKKLDALIDLLPPVSHCPAVCCSDRLRRDVSPVQQTTLDNALKSRYQTVYRDKDEIPDSAWVYDCHFDVCEEVEVHGVCFLYWEPTTAGPLWFKATYSKWHGPGPRTGVDETYVWGLVKWVEVDFKPRAWL